MQKNNNSWHQPVASVLPDPILCHLCLNFQLLLFWEPKSRSYMPQWLFISPTPPCFHVNSTRIICSHLLFWGSVSLNLSPQDNAKFSNLSIMKLKKSQSGLLLYLGRGTHWVPLSDPWCQLDLTSNSVLEARTPAVMRSCQLTFRV